MTVHGSVHSRKGTHRHSDHAPNSCQLRTAATASFLYKGTISVKSAPWRPFPASWLSSLATRWWHSRVGPARGRRGAGDTAGTQPRYTATRRKQRLQPRGSLKPKPQNWCPVPHCIIVFMLLQWCDFLLHYKIVRVRVFFLPFGEKKAQ